MVNSPLLHWLRQDRAAVRALAATRAVVAAGDPWLPVGQWEAADVESVTETVRSLPVPEEPTVLRLEVAHEGWLESSDWLCDAALDARPRRLPLPRDAGAVRELGYGASTPWLDLWESGAAGAALLMLADAAGVWRGSLVLAVRACALLGWSAAFGEVAGPACAAKLLADVPRAVSLRREAQDAEKRARAKGSREIYAEWRGAARDYVEHYQALRRLGTLTEEQADRNRNLARSSALNAAAMLPLLLGADATGEHRDGLRHARLLAGDALPLLDADSQGDLRDGLRYAQLLAEDAARPDEGDAGQAARAQVEAIRREIPTVEVLRAAAGEARRWW